MSNMTTTEQEPHYIVMQEGDYAGWHQVTSPMTWWSTLEASERYYASGRPTRIVELDADERIVREVCQDTLNHDWPMEVAAR